MWWMILLVLMLAIAALLWWRGKCEREWQWELAYLSRHHERANVGSDPESSNLPVKSIQKVAPNVTNMRSQAQSSQATQAAMARAEAKLQQINPRHKASAQLTEADKQHLASEQVLAELPIFAHALTTTLPAAEEAEPVPNDATEVLTEAKVQSEAAAAAPAVAIPMFAHTPDVLVQEAPCAPAKPPADLEVISLAEATRKVATKQPRPALETVKLNWPLPSANEAQTAQNEALSQAEVITLADPALSRIRERTLAEQVLLRDSQTPQPARLADDASSPALPTIHTIDEDDIRANLLRQRLARRRDSGTERQRQAMPAELAVIAEDEVLANLAKTDSPVNRHKHPFKRTTIRESVIPAAARVEHSHTLKLPLAVQSHGAAAPIFTRFTPYDMAPSAEEVPTVQPDLDFVATAAATEAPAADAAPLLHITDTPTWSISDRLVTASQFDGGYDMAAETGYDGYGAAYDASHHPQYGWPAAGSASRDAAPIPREPAWHSVATTTVAPKAYAATRQPTSAAAQTQQAEQPPEEDELPEWLQTLQEARQLSAEKVVPTPTLPPADDAATQPAVAVPQTAMGMALQSAMRQAPMAEALPNGLVLPSLSLLMPPQYDAAAHQSEEALLENGIIIEEKLAEFKVKVNVVDAYSGPVITRYEIEPAQGVRGSQVVNLEKDLARSLGFASIRVVETIPGKTCMGLELPNPKRQIIRLSEIFNAPVFQESRSKLTLALGQDITGAPVVTDLARAPHLLVAGTTGSGKSVGVNAMILSMLFKATPEEVRLIMIDPKMLELSIYEGIAHLLAPVVTDMNLAANALTWCVNEMEKRYRLMSHLGVRNLAGFNQKVSEAAQRGQKLANPFSLTPEDPEPLTKLPFIVVVVDEFADLMMTAGKKIEALIARLAQKARAAGIHLILATQRPSVDVITGLIKANIPTRIAFQVSSKVDSRTILDQMGAENLLGQGDMLFLPPGTGYPRRVHGAFVADEEVHGVVEYLKQFGEPHYVEDILTAGVSEDDLFSNANGSRNNDGEEDPLYDEAVAVVVKTRKASISSVQRQLRIGYNRAARLVEQMEADGIVSAPEGNGNRTVLAPSSSHLDGE